ncbi:protein B4-like [Penaeus vannamei]|uniref:protein B4-like n=1 Tax=Penaeus vannamei TaxID=6689 RepID=UPI00387F4AED
MAMAVTMSSTTLEYEKNCVLQVKEKPLSQPVNRGIGRSGFPDGQEIKYHFLTAFMASEGNLKHKQMKKMKKNIQTRASRVMLALTVPQSARDGQRHPPVGVQHISMHDALAAREGRRFQWHDLKGRRDRVQAELSSVRSLPVSRVHPRAQSKTAAGVWNKPTPTPLALRVKKTRKEAAERQRLSSAKPSLAKSTKPAEAFNKPTPTPSALRVQKARKEAAERQRLSSAKPKPSRVESDKPAEAFNKPTPTPSALRVQKARKEAAERQRLSSAKPKPSRVESDKPAEAFNKPTPTPSALRVQKARKEAAERQRQQAVRKRGTPQPKHSRAQRIAGPVEDSRVSTE